MLLAQVQVTPDIFAPAKFSSLATILNLVIPLIMVGAGVLCFVSVIIAGFMYMNSDGSPEVLKKVRAMLTYTVVGFAIVITSYLLAKLLGTIFSITDLPF